MSSSKVSASLCMAVIFFLLLFSSLTHAGRPIPSSSSSSSSVATPNEVLEVERINLEESCEGTGEEECLMRRTIAAHLDYIYTQKQKP